MMRCMSIEGGDAKKGRDYDIQETRNIRMERTGKVVQE